MVHDPQAIQATTMAVVYEQQACQAVALVVSRSIWRFCKMYARQAASLIWSKEAVEAAGSYPGIVQVHMEIIESAGQLGSYPCMV